MLVQDSDPAHASQRVQDFLSQKIPMYVPKDIWPSNSPDLNPCDFWMWGVVEQKSNSTAHASVSDLKKADSVRQPAPLTRTRPGARAPLSGAVSRV